MSLLYTASFKEFGSLVCLWHDVKLRKKRNLRSGHLMSPGGVTFGVIGSSFFWKCVKLLAEQLWQNWRRHALPFFSLSAKNLRGRITAPPPPAVRGLRQLWIWSGYIYSVFVLIYSGLGLVCTLNADTVIFVFAFRAEDQINERVMLTNFPGANTLVRMLYFSDHLAAPFYKISGLSWSWHLILPARQWVNCHLGSPKIFFRYVWCDNHVH